MVLNTMADNFEAVLLEAPYRKEDDVRGDYSDSHDRKSSSSGRRSRDKSPDRDRDKGRDRDRNRHRCSRSRDRKRNKSRDKGSHSRERERSHSRERSRSREKMHSRSKDRTKHRSKSPHMSKRSMSKSPVREHEADLTPEERDAHTCECSACMQLCARIRPRDLEEFFSSVDIVKDVRHITDNTMWRPGLYVGSLHFNITEDMLKGIFKPFGKIDDIKLIRDHETGKSHGYGFITYHNAEDAKKALEQLNGFELAGRPMQVSNITENNDPCSDWWTTHCQDTDELDRAGIDLGAIGRLQLMAKRAEITCQNSMNTGAPGYPGGPPAQGYPGGPPPQGYPGGPPPQGYPGGAPPQGYPGGAPPQGYPGGPPPGSYQGGPPAGQYPPAPQGQGYPPGGAPPAAPSQIDVQWKGEIPDNDVDDNPNAVPAQPTAPPLEKMDSVAGYQNVGFDSSFLPPPSYDEAMKGGPPQREAVSGLPQIDEDEARNALLQHVAENCCYGAGAAKQMQFTDLKHSSAFHYTLETFGEGRSTSWAFQPYSGQPIDGPQNGPAPGPWDIQANPTNIFQNQKMEIEVPHTASVKPCHNCMAMGRIRCHRCYGRGRVRCTSCGGRGHTTVYRNGEHERERCHWCHGDGRRRCMGCHGCGMVTCMCCQGHCSLKCYIKLTIVWTNHLQDHIVERTALPDALIRNVSGQVAFEEQQPRVWPINHFPDSEINQASQRLVNQHASAFPTERLLMQRHRVRIIPVTQALYKWKGENSDFFVYGFEKKIHAPNYPQQCCCGCTVL